MKSKYDLSLLVPARQEMFLKNTVEDILKNKRANTEIIVGLDGVWADPPLVQHPDVNVVYVNKSIGQRAITKLCAKLSRSKYLAKADAHCGFDEGFDQKMLDFFKIVGDNVTAVPIMKNLHAFYWKCYKTGCGWTKYQGPTPKKCEKCGRSHRLHRKMRWISKHNPQSTSYCFDATPHFQYFEAWKHREPYITDKKEKGYTETMSLQGSFWMLTREKYFDLDMDDENLGSWGHQGLSVACKTWLSGGRVLVNHKSWYSHLFRTQGSDFSFPYPQSGNEVSRTKKRVKDLFWNKQWPKQIHPVSWLVRKFAPVKGWSDEDIKNLEIHEAKFK